MHTSGMQNINIKTEPAGYISFGQLTQEQVEILSHSLDAQEIADELLEIRYNSDGSLEECEGVFIRGGQVDASLGWLAETAQQVLQIRSI